MKKSVILLLIVSIFVIAFMFVSGDKKEMGIKQASVDNSVSEPQSQVAMPHDAAASISDQDTEQAPARPQNGRQLEPEIEKALNELVITSHEGLVEEETDKGVIIDLKGRFRTAPVATIDENGQIVVQDYTSAPGRSN
jgi:hypothetical protein